MLERVRGCCRSSEDDRSEIPKRNLFYLSGIVPIGDFMFRLSLLAAFVTSVLLSPKASSGSDNIDVALTETVPLLMLKLLDKDVKCVGVLPFRLKQQGKPDQFSGSIIQTNVALRVEQAMTVYRNPEKPIDVIFGLLSQARKAVPNAQYINAAGRKELFQLSYDLPVGNAQAKPEALVTGVIEVSADWRDSRIFFEYCLAADPANIFKSGPYALKTDRIMLVSMGRGFSVPAKALASRGVDSELVLEGVQQDVDFQLQEDRKLGIQSPAERVGKPTPVNPFQNAPVTLSIKYDGKAQAFMKDNITGSTNLTVNDPQAGQRVTFELRNNLASQVAVVLAINGRSLLFDEYAANPDDLSKFVLEAGKTYAVDGVYQQDLKGVQPVLGLSDTQSSDMAKKIPSEALGMIHMYIYQPAKLVASGSSQASSRKDNDLASGTQKSIDATSPGGGKSASNSGASGKQSGAGSQQTSSPSPTFQRSEIEQWQSGFDFSLARDAGSKPVRANGTFSPKSTGFKAQSWDDLADGIAKNLIDSSSSSRGLMLGQGSVQQQEIPKSQIGLIQPTDAYVIRYLSVAK